MHEAVTSQIAEDRREIQQEILDAIRPGRVESALNRFIEPIAPGLVARRLEAKQRSAMTRVMMSYAAAYPSLQRETAWGPLVTEEAELQGFSRYQLMLEGRDLYRNMPIIRSGVNGVARRAVGTGLRLQVSTEDNGWNKECLSQWKDWSDGMLDLAGHYDLLGILRQCIRSCYTDGDIGLGMVDEDGDLRVQIIEGDRVAEDYRAGIQIDRHNPIGGVIVDWETGRAESYLVGIRDAGGVLKDSEPWDAESFILFYRRQRVDQVRGVPLLAPVIQTARDLDKYLTATRIAANVQATFGVFIKRNNAAQIQLAQSKAVSGTTDYRTMPMKTGQIWHLNPDEDVTGFSPTVPHQGFDEVSKFWVRIIAIGMGATYESLMNDFTGMSYSSARTHLLEVDSINEEWHRCLVQRVLNRLYRVWVSKRMAKPADGGCGLLPFNPQAYDRVSWIGPKRSSVDPEQEANANIELLANDMITLEDYHLSQGADWRQKLMQRKREREWIEQNMPKVVEPDAAQAPEIVDSKQHAENPGAGVMTGTKGK